MKKLAFLTSLLAIPVCFVACGGSDDPASTATAGSGGAAAGSGGTAAGAGGTAAGAGGTAAGAGGTAAGTGGTSAGAGGSEAGSGGTSAGGEAGAGGAAGTGGTGGTTGGTGGTTGGSGGTTGGTGGTGGTATAKTTSAMCGSVPILGQQGFDTSMACSECVETSCCSEGTACGGVADCSPYRLCVGPCTTKACTDACDAMYPAGITPSSTFATCRNTKCGKACQDFACLGSVGPATPASATVSVVVAPTDFQTGKIIANATVKQCKRTDLTCATPVDTQTTDAMGKATFAAVPTGAKGFDDYFELTEASYQPTLAFDIASSAFKSTPGSPFGLLMISKQTWTLLTGVVGATSDPARGHVAFLAATCKGNRASGVAVTADAPDAMTTLAYIVGSLPSKTATETDGSGVGAFVNLPPGPVTLGGTLVSSGTTIGTNTVFTRAGYVTLTNVIPTP